jgi:hypothetical protein
MLLALHAFHNLAVPLFEEKQQSGRPTDTRLARIFFVLEYLLNLIFFSSFFSLTRLAARIRIRILFICDVLNLCSKRLYLRLQIALQCLGHLNSGIFFF